MGKNLSKALITTVAVTTASLGTLIAASPAKADTTTLSSDASRRVVEQEHNGWIVSSSSSGLSTDSKIMIQVERINSDAIAETYTETTFLGGTQLTQATFSPQPSNSNQNPGGTATVTTDAKLYSDPGTNYSVVISLSQGSKVEILDSVSKGNVTWYRVIGEYQTTNYRSEGWVQGDYLSFTSQPPSVSQSAGRFVTLITDTRAFSGPGTNYIVSAFLARGSVVEILDSVSRGDTTWYKVGGEYGYADYRGAGWVQGDSLGLSPQPSSSNQTIVSAAPELVFQTNNYAVRIYRQGEQMLMNVFNKRDGITFLQGTPVKVEPNPEGYNYTNNNGKVKVKVFQSRSSNTHSIQVGSNSPESSL